MKSVILTAIFALVLVAGSMEDLRAGCLYQCQEVTWPEGHDGTLWCWAGSIVWCTKYFGPPEVQCEVATFFCLNFHAGGGCGFYPQYCCPPGEGTPCDRYGYTPHVVAVGMGIPNPQLGMGFSGTEYTRRLTEEELEWEVCGKGYVVVAFFDNQTSGHAVVICGYDGPQGGQVWGRANINDTNRETYDWIDYPELSAGRLTGGDYGSWKHSIVVTDYDPTQVSIGEIQNLRVGDYYCDAEFRYSILESADPTQTAVYYMSDNPAGPARRIGDEVPVPGQSETFLVTRSGFIDEHYYYMDYSHGPFPWLRSPYELLKASGSPREELCCWEERATVNPPSGVTTSDVDFDFGGSMLVEWDLSLNDSSVDYYNIYRKDSLFVDHNFYQWIGTAPRGSGSFVDTLASPALLSTYAVSAAHHIGLSPSFPNNQGYWNDFDETPEAWSQAVDDFEVFDLARESSDTLVVCPAGDYDTLSISLTIGGSDGLPTVGVPPSLIALHVVGDTMYSCTGAALAPNGPTGPQGTTTFTINELGGRDELACVAEVVGMYRQSGFPPLL